MKRECITCKAATLVAREIDNNIRVIDERPVEGGPLIAFGDLLDQPTIIWGVPVEGGSVSLGARDLIVTADAYRYQLHECSKVTR